MRRKRRSSKSDVLIDLTSLLDVIFIILLIVMWGQNTVETNLKQAQAEAEEAIHQTETERMLYEQQLEITNNIHSYIFAVSVVVPYDKTDVTHRTIQILKEGEAMESFELVGNNVNASIEAFRKSLTEYAEVNKDRPVILSLNEQDDKILYRDEVMVTEIFNELTKEYSNVYIRGSLHEEEK